METKKTPAKKDLWMTVFPKKYLQYARDDDAMLRTTSVGSCVEVKASDANAPYYDTLREAFSPNYIGGLRLFLGQLEVVTAKVENRRPYADQARRGAGQC